MSFHPLGASVLEPYEKSAPTTKPYNVTSSFLEIHRGRPAAAEFPLVIDDRPAHTARTGLHVQCCRRPSGEVCGWGGFRLFDLDSLSDAAGQFARRRISAIQEARATLRGRAVSFLRRPGGYGDANFGPISHRDRHHEGRYTALMWAAVGGSARCFGGC
jgi:hypothetical protein